MPSQKIDHAGSKAERRNGGLALPGGHNNLIAPPFKKCSTRANSGSLLPPKKIPAFFESGD